MKQGHSRTLAGLLALTLAVLAVVYRDTFGTLVAKWSDDAAFSHGFLILPISLWLALRRRHALAGIDLRPSWAGVALLLVCAAAWVVSRGTGILVIEQVAAVAMIPSLVLAILGWSATRALAFPLAFLFFAVPFGRALLPALMLVTADVATHALRWTGVPILRSHMLISIPSGTFEVARACGGLNYAITGLVLGVLYAHLMYRGWVKRLLCVAAFLAVPIIANGVRVYLTILVSHVTEMRYGPGAEHVTFGRVFFLVVLLAMFWIGRRWHDEVPSAGFAVGSHTRPTLALPVAGWAPVPVAASILLMAPAYLAASQAQARSWIVDASDVAVLPVGTAPWQGPREGSRWRPLYRGGFVEKSGVYVDDDEGVVEVFVAAYGLGGSTGAEMISYGNVLTPADHHSLAAETRRYVPLPGGGKLAVREAQVPNDGDPRSVWYWFVVGDRPATSPLVVKALEALSYVMRDAAPERIIAIATRADDGAVRRLESFVSAHSECVEHGFWGEACGT